MSYTIKAYDWKTGNALSFIPEFESAQISAEFSDAGSLSFSYNKLAFGYSTLITCRTAPIELAVLDDGVEIDNGRFFLRDYSGDEVDPAAKMTFNAPSLLSKLDNALVYSGDGSVTAAVDQTFNGATAGGILRALFAQNAARGSGRLMNKLTYATFSNTTDSNGAAWAFTLNGITYTVGVSYLDVMRNLVNNGMVEVKMVGRDIRVYNAGTMGLDRTAQATPVVFRRGKELMESPITVTNEQIASTVLVRGDNNALKQYSDSSVAAAWGEEEYFVSQGGVGDLTTLGVLAQSQADRSKQARIQNTHKISVAASGIKPFIDYNVSDYIWSDRGNGVEKFRVRQLVASISPIEAATVSAVLNDKFLEADIVQARRIDGILGGASAGGSVAIPVDDATLDTTIPKAPASAGVTSAVYVNDSGVPVAQATVTWAAVTQNTDNSTISDLDHYDIQYHSEAAAFTTSPSALMPAREGTALTKLFDRRGSNLGYGWLGADGGCSAPTTDGKAFLSFADTNLGIADQEGKIKAGTWNFINNSTVVIDINDPSLFDAKWGYGNRLTANDAYLASTIGNWQADANCAVARSTTTGFYSTSSSLQVTATAAGNATARTAAAVHTGIVAGNTYSAFCRAKSVGTARQVQIGIRWYDASNALLSTTTSTAAAGSTTVWTRYVVVGTAPTNAVKASVIVTFLSATAAQVFNADVFQLSDGDARYYSWNDPGRALLNGRASVMHPEELGGTVITDFNDILWTDTCITIGTKIYVWYNRYTRTGTYKNQTAIAIFDGTTKQYESLTSFTSGDTFVWSSMSYQDATYLYTFGLEVSGSNRLTHLMRTPIGNPILGTKEYRTGAGAWSTTRASSVAVMNLFAGYPGGIMKIGSTFYAPYTIYGEGVMRLLSATDITGTWTDLGSIYTQPELGSGIVAYFARIHPHLSTNASGIPMSYSVNGTVQGFDSTKNIRYYSPKFLLGPVAGAAAASPTGAWLDLPPVSGTTTYVGNLKPGNLFEARVRASDSNGNKSSFTIAGPVILVGDTTPPNQPSAPIVSANYQGLRIEWNGLDFQGGPPPQDWASLEVHISEVNNFVPGSFTKYDTFSTVLGGVSNIQGLEYGHTYYVRFVAVDLRGNRSTPSDVGSATPEQLVNTAEIGEKLITGAKIADGAINVRQLTVAAFEPSIVPNGTFETDATDASGNSTGVPYGWGASPWNTGAGLVGSTETSAPVSGTRSLKLVAASASDGGRWQSAVFPVVEGKLLAVSVKVRGSRAVAATNAFEVHIVCGNTEANTGAFPASGTSVWGFSAGVAATTSVQTIELQRTVDTSMKFARVFVSMNASGDGSGWTGYFDDVIVAPVGGSAFIADLSVLTAKIANLAVNDAKIANLSVGKLTAGTLSADITVSARIKTSDTGARVELNSAGLQAYNSAGNKTVDVSSSTGAAVFTGSIRTAFPSAGVPHVEIIDSGDRSTIYLYGPATNYAYINSPSTTGTDSPSIGMWSGSFPDPRLSATTGRHRIWLSNGEVRLETLKEGSSPLQPYGGQIWLHSDAAWLRMLDSGGVERASLEMGSNSIRMAMYLADTSETGYHLIQDTGDIYMKGAFYPNATIQGYSTLFCGYQSATSVSSVSISYGITMANGLMRVLYSVYSTSSSSNVDHHLTAMTATGFTVTWVSSVANLVLDFWAYKIVF